MIVPPIKAPVPIHVTVDTSVVRHDSQWRTAPAKAIVASCKKGLLKLYIPEMVTRELLSQDMDKYRAHFSVLAPAAQALIKKPLSEGLRAKLSAIPETAEAVRLEADLGRSSWLRGPV